MMKTPAPAKAPAPKRPAKITKPKPPGHLIWSAVRFHKIAWQHTKVSLKDVSCTVCHQELDLHLNTKRDPPEPHRTMAGKIRPADSVYGSFARHHYLAHQLWSSFTGTEVERQLRHKWLAAQDFRGSY